MGSVLRLLIRNLPGGANPPELGLFVHRALPTMTTYARTGSLHVEHEVRRFEKYPGIVYQLLDAHQVEVKEEGFVDFSRTAAREAFQRFHSLMEREGIWHDAEE